MSLLSIVPLVFSITYLVEGILLHCHPPALFNVPMKSGPQDKIQLGLIFYSYYRKGPKQILSSKCPMVDFAPFMPRTCFLFIKSSQVHHANYKA